MARQSDFIPLQSGQPDKVKLKRAVQSVHDGLSIRRTAEEYGIPKSTLYDHVSSKVALNARHGRHKHLDSVEETNLS